MADGEQAREELTEILRQPLQPSTEDSLELAEKRLEQAHERTRSAHLKSGRAHDLAAKAHEQAAADHIGDVEIHTKAAAEHRVARDNDYRLAEE